MIGLSITERQVNVVNQLIIFCDCSQGIVDTEGLSGKQTIVSSSLVDRCSSETSHSYTCNRI